MPFERHLSNHHSQMESLEDQLKNEKPLPKALAKKMEALAIAYRRLNQRAPSTVTDTTWLLAQAPRPASPNVNSGKFLVFRRHDAIDEAWAKIKLATEQGLLGPAAKVSTRHPRQLAQNPRGAVICVYVSNADDLAEKERVRVSLDALGFHNLPFKLDAATLRGEYSKGFKRAARG